MKSIIIFLILVNFNAFGQNSSPIQLKWNTNYPFIDSLNNQLTADSKNTAVDNQGNVCVVVSELSDQFPFYRFKLTKYNSSGIILWQVKSDKIESNNFQADIIETDDSNNIYVVAHTLENNIPGGLIILKFNAGGLLFWIRKYNGNLINSFSIPVELKFDGNGSLILMGYSGRVENNVTQNDSLLLIKYTSLGTRVWTAKTNNDSIIYKAHCKIDDFNNVYVSGESATFSHQIRFIKYNSQGERIWKSSYYDKNYYYTAIDMATDFNGLHYLIASSNTLNFNSKWITIMFDQNGVSRWARYEDKNSSSDVYETPLLLSLGDGFISVLGYEYKDDISYFYLIKYDVNGNKVSDQAYRDTTIEYIQKVLLDDSGNLYTAGFTQNPDKIYLFKFDNNGNKAWSDNFYSGGINGFNTGMNLILNNSGYIYLTTEDSSKNTNIHEVVTSKYDISNGEEVWTVRSNEYLQHQAVCMHVDGNGNIYLAGWIQNGRGYNQDFLTVKFNSAGKLIWGNRYHGPARSTDIPSAIAVDNIGNVYVTGESMGMSSNFDFATVKYNSIGEEEWSARYDGGDIDKPQAIEVGKDESIYVAGSSKGTGSNYDFVTIKYNKFGQLQWIQRYNDENNGKDSVVSMAIDKLGNIYVAGTSDSTNSIHTFLILKYSSSGGKLWAERYHDSGYEWENAKKIVIDNRNNIYITGTGYKNNSKDDILTVKFNTDGLYQWSAVWNDQSNSVDETTDMKADMNGNIYVTGYGAGSGTGNDFITIKYDSSGARKWAVTYNNPQNTDDISVSLALDYMANSYIVGFSLVDGYFNYSLVKYDTTGEKLWNEDIPNNSFSNYIPVGLVVDNYGDIIIGGYDGNLIRSSFNLYKYSQPGFIPTGILESSNKINAFRLYQNYPNPFNPVTTIKYSIPARSFVSIKLYDILGREIKTLLAEEKDAGDHEMVFDGSGLSSGVYFYTMKTNNFVVSKKMIILK